MCNQDHADVVTIVAHLCRIAARPDGEGQGDRSQLAAEISFVLCQTLGLDHAQIAEAARHQAHAMGRPS